MKTEAEIRRLLKQLEDPSLKQWALAVDLEARQRLLRWILEEEVDPYETKSGGGFLAEGELEPMFRFFRED